MGDFWHHLGLAELMTAERILVFARAAIILGSGWILARLVSRATERAFSRKMSPQETMLLRRLIFYTLFGLVLAAALHQLGFKLGVLLGAAGVLTVAIGFASQTSASNLISGLFLVAERPFVVGDVVKIEDVTGEVLSVDLLSVKLRTFDNLYIRVPNESVIKNRVTNLTFFPLRRVDLIVSVAYRENLAHVQDVLMKIADENPLAMEDPAPLIIFQQFGASSIDLQFSVWGRRQNYLALKNSIAEDVKRTFDAEDIEIPFPHVSVYAGSRTSPFPVQTEVRERRLDTSHGETERRSPREPAKVDPLSAGEPPHHEDPAH
ncbi:MAG: mechanosensitive ion channel family protein [Candidatus Eisenbacteria bacterium]